MTETLWAIAAAVVAGIILAGIRPLAQFIGRAVAREVVDTMGAALAKTRKQELEVALKPLREELLVGPEKWPNGSTSLPEAMTAIYEKLESHRQHICDIQKTLEVIQVEGR